GGGNHAVRQQAGERGLSHIAASDNRNLSHIPLLVRIRRCRSAPWSPLLQSRIRNHLACPLQVRSSHCREFFRDPVAPPVLSNHGNRTGNLRQTRQEAESSLIP